MSTSFRLPRFAYRVPLPKRMVEELYGQMVRQEYPVVRCTLADLQAALHAEGDAKPLVYETSIPTGIYPGKRWLSRDPQCWKSHRPLAPLYLVEITPFDSPTHANCLVTWRWRIEIEHEAIVQAWLRALGPQRADELSRLVCRGSRL